MRSLLLDFANVLAFRFPEPGFITHPSLPGYYLNAPLITFLSEYSHVLSFYIYSNSSPFTLQLMKEIFPDTFTDVISVQTTGWYKGDPDSYTHIANLLGVKIEDIVFIDDSLDNIEIAQAAGVTTVHFISTAQTLNDLDTLLPSPDKISG